MCKGLVDIEHQADWPEWNELPYVNPAHGIVFAQARLAKACSSPTAVPEDESESVDRSSIGSCENRGLREDEGDIEQDLVAWDCSQYRLERRLAMTLRRGRRIEVYVDEHTGERVAAKRFAMSRHKGRENTAARESACLSHEIAMAKRLGCTASSCSSFVYQFRGAYRDSNNDVLLVTDLVRGGDLIDLIRSSSDVEPGAHREKMMTPVVRALLHAVCGLHQEGIAHGDISLENIVKPAGTQKQVVLVDFEHASTQDNWVRTGKRGKENYQAPEMHEGGKWDARYADLFACGVVCFCLVVGTYPWLSTVPGACPVYAHVNRDGLHGLLQQRLIRSRNASEDALKPADCLSREMIALLGELFAKDPRRRLGGPGLKAFMALDC